MLIISKFRDYYDSAATYGIDKTVVYKREIAEKPIERYRKDIDRADKHGETRVSFHLVGFCGKVYPGAMFELGDKKICVYTAEQFFLEAVDFGLNVDWKAKHSSWSHFKFWRGGINAGHVKHFFDKDWTKEFGRYFVELHQPIFVINSGESRLVLLNGYRLKDLQFAKVKDPATAFQEIYLYISGVLGQPLEPPKEPSDKEKAQIHGHGGEYSFKKLPGGKKWR